MMQRQDNKWEKIHKAVEAGMMSNEWQDDERREAQCYAQKLIANSQVRIQNDLVEFSRLCRYLSDTRLFFDTYPPLEMNDAA
jgi:hypothetical protein